jgi:hypothetical protein
MPYIGRPLNAGNLSVDVFTGNASTTVFTLTYSVGSSNSIGVYLDGVRQLAGTDFTASGTVLTFTTAPANGVGIDVYFLGLELSIPTPGDDTVTGAKIVDNAINSEHYTDGSIDTAHIAVNQIDETLMKDALVADFTEVVVAAADSFLLGDSSDSGKTKRDTIAGILALASTSASMKLVIASYDISTASGTQDITGFGFDPAFVIGFGGVSNVTITTLGASELGVNTACLSTRGTAGQSFITSSLFMRFMVAASNAQDGAVSAISDGVRITWSKGGSPTGTAAIYIIGFK